MRRTDDDGGAARPCRSAGAVGARDTARRSEDRLEWNADQLAQLRALWKGGATTAEIARQMNASKNAIVGKAHRLHLPPRPSPIKRDESALAAHLENVLVAIQAGKTTGQIAEELGITSRAVDDAVHALRRRGKLSQPTTTLPPLASLSAPALVAVASTAAPPKAASLVRPYTPGRPQAPVAPPPTVAAPPASSAVPPPAPARYGRVIPSGPVVRKPAAIDAACNGVFPTQARPVRQSVLGAAPAIDATEAEIRAWAAAHSVHYTGGQNLARVNAIRQHLGHPPYRLAP